MNRRTMIAGAASAMLIGSARQGQATAASGSYRLSLIGGAYDNGVWRAGIAIDLDDGWKTYWRMPGEAGIPPQFDWTKSLGVASIDVLYPLPRRFRDLSGETVGYETRVVFPVLVKATSDAAARLELQSFFAVCKDVCIPAKAQAERDLAPLPHDDPGNAAVADWLARVPSPGMPITSARIDRKAGALVVGLAEPADDIFVESTSSAYFRAPQFAGDGLSASLVIDNLADVAELKGASLTFTVARSGRGLEQARTVD